MTLHASPYAISSAKLIERGYSAIPIAPGTKRPGYRVNGKSRGMNDWQRFCGRAPTNIRSEHWASLADTAIGIALGFNNVIAVDIDTDVKAIIAAIGGCLPYTPASSAAQKERLCSFAGRLRHEVTISMAVEFVIYSGVVGKRISPEFASGHYRAVH